MTKTLSISREVVLKLIILDVISVLAVYMIPALSHMVVLPLYYLDPMRVIILLGFMINRNKLNSMCLAILLPLVSFLLSGHPIAIKNGIIVIELFTNICLLSYLLKKEINASITIVVSIIASKFIYYSLKCLAIHLGYLNTSLIDTSIIYQLVVIGLLCLCWYFYSKIQHKFNKNLQ